MITAITGITGITGIERRIAVVESKIAVRRGTSTGGSGPAGGSLDVGAPPDPLLGFDPFGAAYQRAVQASGLGAQDAANSNASSTSDPAINPAISSNANGMRIDNRSTVGQVGGYGPMPVPPELASYGNGQIPAGALEPVGQGDHRLYAPAANAWKAAVAAARSQGIDLRLTDSYRSYDQQVALAAAKGLTSDGGLAAAPGTSNHGWGLAVDVNVDDAAARIWLRANGHRFGFVEAVRGEPWHWEFRPSQA